ncbi:MAG: hypothetical protein L6R41_002046 [Letrouitia leprolyta]|nr:MAG: hypothetical protein L6R41_002046 [Letrouitia leprolyta]
MDLDKRLDDLQAQINLQAQKLVQLDVNGDWRDFISHGLMREMPYAEDVNPEISVKTILIGSEETELPQLLEDLHRQAQKLSVKAIREFLGENHANVIKLL